MNKKGFTMVELVVSLAVMAVLATAATAVVAPIFKTYQRTAARAQAQMIGGNIVDSLRKGIMNVGNIRVVSSDSGDTLDTGRGVYGVDDSGRLTFEQQPVFDEKYYHNLQISLKMTELTDQVVEVWVTVLQRGDTLCTVQGVLSPLRRVLEN